MRRRASESEAGFGSDSFLDIIANIVGILIILIVVAGVKVARSPIPQLALPADSSTDRPAENEPLESGDSEVMTLQTLDEQVRSEPLSLPALEASSMERNVEVPLPFVVPSLEPIVIEPSRELVEQTRSLERRLQQTRTVIRQLEDSLQQERSDLGNADHDSGQIQVDLARMQQQLARATRDEAALKDALKRAQAELKRLQAELADAQATPRNVVQIEHKMTSLARAVNQREMHFRLAANRVSHVPVEELLERLKGQVERQKDWLMKFHRHEGVVGPVTGYSMKYVVERQTLSAIDRLKYGSGMVRIGVSEWVIERGPGLESESMEEALRAQSLFQRKLLSAEPGTVITFWVYPDSFALYRALRQAAHQEGFEVAGRPIPQGMPIAGGPRGSRSLAQ